ncbi:MAG: GGDEF domain-containing protein [Gammaproteobacteria bacterium]
MQTKTTDDKHPLLLIADDEPSNIHVMVEALIADYRIKVATDGRTALEIATQVDQPDLIILDIQMPEMDGLEVCKTLKHNRSTQHIPVMFVSAHNDANVEFEALKLEAIEFIGKPVNPATLRMRVRNLVKLKQLQDQLLELSTHDQLTGIANRRRFDEFLDWEWRRALRVKRSIALIMFDVDLFKAFNDHYGHVEGDQCLKQIAITISAFMQRPGDLAARYGGEEFGCILASTNLTDSIAIADTCRKQIVALQIPHISSPFGVVTVSCGVYSTIPLDMSSQSTLVKLADKKLYFAKESGRNRVEG